MSILFAGSELGDFDADLTYGATHSTSSYTWDSVYSRVGMETSGSSYLGKKIVPQSEVWVKATFQTTYSSTTNDYYVMRLSSEIGNIAQLVGTGNSSELRLERWDGSAWQAVTTIPNAFEYGSVDVYTHICMRVKIAVDGLIVVYANSLQIAIFEGDTSGLGDVSQIRLGAKGYHATYKNVWSEVIVASHDVRSARLKTLDITGAGAVNEWSGTYLDIEGYNNDDDSFISSDVAEQKALFSKDATLAEDTLNVDAVVLSGRFRQNETGPSNIDAIVRVDGNDYSKNIGDLGSYFTSHQVIFAVNPATAAPWTREAVEAAQIGLQSKA